MKSNVMTYRNLLDQLQMMYEYEPSLLNREVAVTIDDTEYFSVRSILMNENKDHEFLILKDPYIVLNG